MPASGAITSQVTFGFSKYDGSLGNGDPFNQTIEADGTTDQMSFSDWRIDEFEDPDFGVNMNDGGPVSVFSDPDGDSFQFLSFTTEVFCGSPMTFDVVGYEDGSPVSGATQSFSIDGTTGVITRTVGFASVDEVRFENYSASDGNQCLKVDNIILDQAVTSNTQPAFTNLDATVMYDEATGSPVVIDGDAEISDAELDDANDYASSTLTVERTGGANPDDEFGFDTDAGAFSVSGGDMLTGGNVFASFTESGGTLTINFNSSQTAATSTLVDDVLQGITYANPADPDVVEYMLILTFDDGDAGGALQVSDSRPVVVDPELAPISGSTTLDFTAQESELSNGDPVDARIIQELLFYGFDFEDASEDSLVTSSGLQLSNATSDKDTTPNRFESDTSFLLDSIDIENFSTSAQDVTVHGYRNGALEASETFSFASEAAPQTFDLDALNTAFLAVDELRFTTSENDSVAIDNIVVDAGNQSPTLDLDTDAGGNDHTAAFTENAHQGDAAADGVAVTGPVLVDDPDGDPETITVTLDNNQGDTGEQLYLDNGGLVGAVTGAGSGDSLTLVRHGASPAALADTLTNVRYQNDDDTPTEETDRTITIVATDDLGATTSATSTVTVEAGNDAPTITATGDTLQPTEDVAFDLSGANEIQFADVDAGGATVEVSLSANNGTLTFGSTAGLTFDSGGNGVDAFTVSGTVVDLNNALATLTYLGNANYFGDDTISVTVNDRGNTGTDPGSTGDGSSEAASTMVELDVQSVPDAPTISTISDQTTNEDTTLSGVAFTVDDAETAAGDLSLSFSADTPSLIASHSLGGSDGNRTLDIVPTADQSGSTLVTVEVEDASGRSTSEDFTLTVNPINDEPTLAATGHDPTFTEGGAAVTLFGSASIETVESGQTISGLTFTVSDVDNGSDEQINIDGSTIELTHGTNGTTTGNNLGYSVSVAGATATVSLTGGSLSTSAAQTLVNSISYQNNSVEVSASTRNVTLTSVTDSGGTANGGNDTATFSIASTVSLADDVPPVVSDAYISLSGSSGNGGTYILGDTVTATWDNTASGDNNRDTISSVTVDFSAFGGGSSVAATNNSDAWSATYTIDDNSVSGSDLNVSVSATDNADNTVTVADSSDAEVDNSAPTGHSVSFNNGTLNGTEADSTSFTFANAEVGTDYSYTITSSGGGTPVTDSGTLASAGEQVSGIDASSLPDGTLTLSVTLTDTAGNTADPVTDTATLDATAPTTSLSTTASDPTNGAFDITVTFSETVSGFDASDITATNASLSNFSGSGSSYTTTVTPTADGSVSVDVAAGVVQDTAGNDNTAAPSLNMTYDVTPPQPVITNNLAGDPTNQTSYTASISFGESVVDFQVDDITASNASLSGFTDNGGGDFEVAIAPVADGPVSLDIASGVATDAAGNQNLAATTDSINYDGTPPEIVDSSPSGAEPDDTQVIFQISISETVESLAIGDFALTTTGSATGTVDSLSASSGDSITVTTSDVSGEGTLRLDYTGTGATDAAGNPLGSFTGGTEHTVDTEAPDAPGLAFDQDPVTEANGISLTLSGAETGTSAEYTITSDGGGTAVTGSANITSANQTLSSIDVSGLGDGTLTAEVTLSDDAGNTSNAGNATADKDAKDPAVNSVEATDGHYAEGDTLVIVVEMNENVEVSGTEATLDIDIGPNTRTAGFASEVDGVLQFNYTIQADENTNDNGVTVLASSIARKGDTIRDSTGNDADLNFASNSNPDAQVDTVEPDAPTVTAPSEAVSVNDADYTLVGDHGEDGVVINLYADADENGVADDNTVLESATVEDGNWSVDYTLNQNADNALVAVAEDSAGNAADPVRVPVITHDDIAPDAPEDLALDTDSDSGADDSDRLTNITSPELTGTAEADAVITLSSDQDGEIGTATADDNGDWTLTTDELDDGEHELTAEATDAADNTGDDSEALTLTLDTTAPTLGDLADQFAPANQSTGALSIELNDDRSDPADVRLEASSSDTTVVPEAAIDLAGAGDERTIEVTPAQPGSATLTVEAEDEAGNQASISFRVSTNTPPVIDGTPPGSAEEGEVYEFVPNASDADGDDLVFSIAGQPSWLSFDPATGTLSGIPTQGDIGQHENIRISVTDGTASASLAPFSIEVSAGVDSDGDGVSDHQEELDGTDPNDPDDYRDNTPPELDAPDDRVLDAEALYTRVTLGQLLGLDAEAGDEAIDLALGELANDDFDGEGCCNPSVADMENDRLLLPPGEHQVVWQAEDRKGNRIEAAQTVRLRPLVSLSKDQTTVEGTSVTVSVILNGESPFYPLTVPYTIDEAAGSANDDDHDLSNGTVTFEDGETHAEITVNIAEDGIGEGEETLVVRLDDRTEDDEDLADGYNPDDPDIHDINSGNKTGHQIVIAEGNVAPRVALHLEQNGERRLLIARDGGPVTVNAEVADPNEGESHELDWSESDNVLVDTDGDNSDETFVFDPVDLSPGRYSLALRATDSAGDTGFRRRHFVVVPVPPVLSEDEDRNNNGLSDAEEGAGDKNNNGISDYRDNAPSTNVLPEDADGTPDFMMECDPGVLCTLGRFSLAGENGGSRLVKEDLLAQEDIRPDTLYEPVGGIFDFEVSDLPEPGQTVRIVAPQREPVPADAVYRKYLDGEWRNFVENERNQLHSAEGDPGYCPPPGNEAWEAGLNEGHYCVQLTLEDGGPNDADGEANGTVADPGAVSRPAEDTGPEPEEPDTEDPEYDGEVTSRSDGGGTTGTLPLLVLAALAWRRLRRSAPAGQGKRGTLPAIAVLAVALMGAPEQSRADEPHPIADMRLELGLFSADSSVSGADFARRLSREGIEVQLDRYDAGRRAFSIGVDLPLADSVSVGLGYLNLGDVSADFRTAVDRQSRLRQSLQRHHPTSSQGWTLSQRLRLPLYGKLRGLMATGLYIWRSETRVIGPDIRLESEKGADLFLALGLEYPLNDRVDAGVKVQRLFFDNQQVNLMGATLNWRF